MQGMREQRAGEMGLPNPHADIPHDCPNPGKGEKSMQEETQMTAQGGRSIAILFTLCTYADGTA